MKIKYFFFFLFCCLSFIVTEQIAIYYKNTNPLMQDINNISESLAVSSINSQIIDDLYIIPGLNGKTVNKNKSFINMKNLKEFTLEKIIYDDVKPQISLEDHKDKIIIRGNENKKSIALIFSEYNKLTSYMLKNNYHIDVLLNKEEYNLKFELINNSKDENTYKKISKYLKKNKASNNLCYIKDKIPAHCHNKYLVKASLNISPSNFNDSKNNIKPGEIIYLSSSLSLAELEILLRQIKYQDLNIVYLSELISETN